MKNQKAILCITAIVILGSIFTQAVYAAYVVVATVPVGKFPIGVAYDSGKGEIFVACEGNGTVSVIDDTTNTVVATVKAGSFPHGVAYDSAKGEVFVANNGYKTVSVIDDTTNTVVDTITVGDRPYGVAYDSGKGEMFVTNRANSGNGTVSVIRDSDNTVVATITVATSPEFAAYDSAKGEVFVANQGSNIVSVINDTTNTVVDTITVGSSPRGIAYNSGMGEMFVANEHDGTISVIRDSDNTVVATVPVGKFPIGVAYDPAKGEVFVTNYGSNTVSVIDDTTNTVVATVTVGSVPRGIAYDSGKGEIFVANNLDSTVSVIDAGDPKPSSRNGGHVYYPPSIGNDYHNQYGNGVTINGHSFNVTNYHSVIPQQVLTIGNPATFDFKIYDERGGNTVSHVGMYLHFKGDVMAPNADTWISWDKKDGVQIHDPNKIFSYANVTTTTDTHYRYATFTLTPQKPMPDSSLIMRMWDDKLASGDVPIWGAIIIVDPNAPVPVQKIPDNQYGDYVTLQNILDKDGYQIPSTLRHESDMQQSYDSVDINWVYDKSNDKLTMIESDKAGNLVGSIVYTLYKKSEEPKITDHDYMYIPKQLSRYDVAGEKLAMKEEAQKAEKYLSDVSYIDSTAPDFVPSVHAMPILGYYEFSKMSQLYKYDHQTENAVMKSEAQKAEGLVESLGLLRQNNFENLSN